MKDYKAGWRYYFFLIFFALASALGIRVIWMLLGGEVMDGDEEMGRGMAIVLSVLIALAFSTYIETSVVMLWQLLRFHGSVLRITDNGVENTLVYVNVLAFVFVFPVKLIPWDAVKYADLEDEVPYIRLKTKEVDAGGLAKLILWILGYQFCLPFVKPKVSSDDVKQYCHRFSVSE
ncbi:MAG: hypothetical protein E7436_07365 [Ruminococcaceae bacterium]|nr:hypothetical protein [Oscillospiraceae bacterium]